MYIVKKNAEIPYGFLYWLIKTCLIRLNALSHSKLYFHSGAFLNICRVSSPYSGHIPNFGQLSSINYAIKIFVFVFLFLHSDCRRYKLFYDTDFHRHVVTKITLEWPWSDVRFVIIRRWVAGILWNCKCLELSLFHQNS